MLWLQRTFDELSPRELYAILWLRAEIFVVEQRSIYQDVDGRDPEAVHLIGRREGDPPGPPAAYARWLVEEGHVRLGRIVVRRDARGTGLGRRLLEEALGRIAAAHPNRPVLLHAQEHLAGWYAVSGFEITSEPFDEDGIPHVVMVRGYDGG